MLAIGASATLAFAQTISSSSSGSSGGESGGKQSNILVNTQINDVRPPKDSTYVGQWIEDKTGVDIELVQFLTKGLARC